MSKQVNIEKVLFPKVGELIKGKEGGHSMTIVDIELDPIEVAFNHDGCAEIDTAHYSYITLSLDNLYQLALAIEKIEEEG